MDKKTLSFIVLIILWFIYQIIEGLIKGRISTGSFFYVEKAKNPRLFWLQIFATSFLVALIVCCLVLMLIKK